MCDMLAGDEEILDVPASALKHNTGFAIDFGGSVIKFVYATDHGENVRLHFLMYPADRMKEAFTKFAAKVQGLPQGMKVFTCGLGCNEHSKYIQELLKCQMSNVMETDCFVDAFQFLERNFSMDQIVHPESQTVTSYATTMSESLANAQHSLATTFKDSCRGKMWESSVKLIDRRERSLAGDSTGAGGAGDDSSGASVRKEGVSYPTLLMVCGSATSPLKVEEDGGYLYLDTISTSGKTLLALGSLLTGAKTFEELASLAEKGSLDNLDITGRILKTQSADVYASLSSEFTAFAFGQAVGKDIGDFSRNDLALGVISMLVRTLVDSFHNWALITGVKQIYFSGGIHATCPLIREMMGKYFAYKSKMNPLGKETEHYFLRHGTYLGALGALLKTLNAENS